MEQIIKEKLYSYHNHILNNLYNFERSFDNIENLVISANEHLQRFFKNDKSKNEILNYLFLKDSVYSQEETKEKIISSLRNSYIVCEKEFNKYLRLNFEFDLFLNSLKLKSIDSRTLNQYKKEIDLLNEKLFELFMIFHCPTYNDFLHQKKVIRNSILKIVDLNIRIMNLIFEDLWYLKKINFNKLKKLSFEDLNEGDILVLNKSNSILNSFRLLAKNLLGSNFIHSSIIYKKSKEKIYVFEALAYDKKEVIVEEIERGTPLTYVVLRPKNKLTPTQLKKIKLIEESQIGIKYSFLKVFGAFFQRHKEKYFQDSWFPFFRKKNPFRNLKGSFCSEVVAKVYSEVGVKIGFVEDNSIVSPLDILNSSSLEIVGFYK